MTLGLWLSLLLRYLHKYSTHDALFKAFSMNIFAVKILLALTLVANFSMWSALKLAKSRGPEVHSLSWQQSAAAKRIAIFSKIPKEWHLSDHIIQEAKQRRNLTDYIEGLLDPEDRRITSLDTVEVVSTIANGSLTAVQAVTAFSKRTAFAHQLNNNLLDFSFEYALECAEKLDQHCADTGQTVGPLHGLPITFKDQFHVKGAETTLGYVGWIDTFEGVKGTGKEGVFESELVRELVALGAIPIAKTSLTQTLWYPETNNNIVGYNWNPHNQLLSSGGSSGGQGALLALRGTTVGFGSDTGGSVSMPAAFNGVYSIKPSSGRLSFRGVPTSSPAQRLVPTVAGILGTSLSGLQLVFRSLMEARPWLSDPGVVELPWNQGAVEEISHRARHAALRFGFMEDDGVVIPHPPILRGMRMVREALERKGHAIVTWKPPNHEIGVKLHADITDADGGVDVIERLKLSGEPPIPELKDEFGDEPEPPLPLLDYFDLTLRLKEYQESYHDYWMTTAKNDHESASAVDAVILPIAAHAAVIPGQWYHFGYTSVASVLDVPTIIIPVTKADREVDTFDEDYKPRGDEDRSNWKAYEPDKYDGAPVAVQIMGRRLGEEQLLALAQIVVEALADSGKREVDIEAEPNL